MDRDGKTGVHLDGSSLTGVSRLEVIEGPTGRRRRTKAERVRIAAESLMPGVRVADIARKHGTTRWQIYDWRKQLRKGALALPQSVAAVPFLAELVVEDAVSDAPPQSARASIEIEVGAVVIRAGADVEEGHLVRVIRAARAAVT